MLGPTHIRFRIRLKNMFYLAGGTAPNKRAGAALQTMPLCFLIIIQFAISEHYVNGNKTYAPFIHIAQPSIHGPKVEHFNHTHTYSHRSSIPLNSIVYLVCPSSAQPINRVYCKFSKSQCLKWPRLFISINNIIIIIDVLQNDCFLFNYPVARNWFVEINYR